MFNIPFLQQIVRDHYPEGSDPLAAKDHCYVFPSKRAGIFFRKYLAECFKNRFVWSPHVFSIVEFTEYLSESVLLDNTTLVFELYGIYKRHEPEVQFDSFYAWGMLLLKDFDEIDKHLINATDLFANLRELRSLEEQFALPQDRLAYLEQFWRVFHKPENTRLESEFIKIWQVLGEVYSDLQAALLQNNAAYEGMAQKWIVSQLEAQTLPLPFKKITFCGFNALSVVEKRMIDHLVKYHQAQVYWDIDAYYINDQADKNEYGKSILLPNRQEAGLSLRQYYAEYVHHLQHKWIKTDFKDNPPKIDIVGIPLKVGQAKYVGECLLNDHEQGVFRDQDTAIVLCDETLLLPMLYALPPEVQRINVTMGYPLRDNPLYLLLENILQMHKTRQQHSPKSNKEGERKPNNEPETQAKTAYYNKIVVRVLNHPLIKAFDKKGVESYMSYSARYNLVYVYAETVCKRLENADFFALLFQTTNHFLDLIALYEALLIHLFKHLSHNQTQDPNKKQDEYDKDNELNGYDNKQTIENDNSAIESSKQKIEDKDPIIDNNEQQESKIQQTTENLSGAKEKKENDEPNDSTAADNKQTNEALTLEFIYHTLLQLKKLEATLHKYRHQVSFDTFWRLFRELLQSVSLPFEGEPLEGLQIMGFLEARTLDFKNLYVLGLNEGAVPSSKPNMTFIPFNIRRAFGLPTSTEQDAIYAYHFYRMLQRTQKACLIYNTEVGRSGGGEKSRFLLQLEYEMPRYAPNIDLNSYIVATPLPTPLHPPIPAIPKQGDVATALERYRAELEHDDETNPLRSLSPTHITTYINCPMQFYYKFIARLSELENIDEEINAIIFGNVMHRTIELLYQPYRQRPIEENTIKRILNNDGLIERRLNKAFVDNNFEVPKEGQNLLLKRVLKKLVRHVLQNDLQDAPFNIIGLEAEKEYKTQLELPDGKIIALAGTIDRLDEITLPNGLPAFRILDYKTGNVVINDGQKAMQLRPNDYFDKYFSDPEFKTGFQAYWYAYLFWRKNERNNDIRIVAGLYELKRLSKGIRYVRNGQPIGKEFFEAFEQRLKQLLTDLFNTDLPFERTTEPERYAYSPYKQLAGFADVR